MAKIQNISEIHPTLGADTTPLKPQATWSHQTTDN